MKTTDLSINAPFVLQGEMGYVSIHPEMYPTPEGIIPLGSFFIFCMHPIHGTCYFIVEKDQEGNWICEHKPPFIDQEFINWVGGKIDNFSN